MTHILSAFDSMHQTCDLQLGHLITLKAFGLTAPHYRRRLMSLGLRCGVQARLIRKAPLGCPLYFEVGSCLLALRKEEAKDLIWEPACSKY